MTDSTYFQNTFYIICNTNKKRHKIAKAYLCFENIAVRCNTERQQKKTGGYQHRMSHDGRLIVYKVARYNVIFVTYFNYHNLPKKLFTHFLLIFC